MTASLLEMHEAKGGDEAEAVAIMDTAAITYAGKPRMSSMSAAIVTSHLPLGGTDTACLVDITTVIIDTNITF